MSAPFLAEVRIFAGNFAPRGWAFCNGQLLAISQNTALFSLVGTFYGGNGTTNFALPNLQGLAPMGNGQGPGLSQRTLGETGGEAAVTLLQSEMPSHTHSAKCDSAVGTLPGPTGNVWAASTGGRGRPTPYAAATSGAAMSAAAIGPTGTSQPHNNMSPYLVLNFIIALQGIFPARN
jgi:microcystin-dependent protein